MASTYENDLRLEEMATGENSGSWGTKTNTNLELIADAFSYGTETIADADTTITIADGAADAARSLALKINSSADLTTTRTITLAPNTTSKVWIIENNTSGGQTLTISAGSGTNITLANGTTKIIATDGIGAGSNVVELTQDLAIADLSVDNDLTVGDDIIMNSDGAKIDFGSDSEIQLTHVADTGLLLTETGGGAPTLQFRDSGLAISSSADGQLDIDSDGTIDINATTSIAFDTDTLYVDSANDRVGINGSSPEVALQVYSSDINNSFFDGSNATGTQVFIRNSTVASDVYTQLGFAPANNILGGSIVVTSDEDFSVADNRTAHMELKTRHNGNIRSRLYLDENNTIFNEDSRDTDFRVESDSNTHMLFVDAGNNSVKINSNSTTYDGGAPFQIGPNTTLAYGPNIQTSNRTYVHFTGAGGGSANNSYIHGYQVNNPAAGSYLRVAPGLSNNVVSGVQQSQDGLLYVYNSGKATGDADYTPTISHRIDFGTGGSVAFNENSVDLDFRVESDGNTHMLYVDAGANHVNIGTSTDLGGMLNVAGQIKQQSASSVALQLESTQADNNTGPYIYLYGNSSSPAANDITGGIVWRYNDDGGSEQSGMQINHILYDVAAASDDTGFAWYNKVGGTDRQIFTKTNSEIIVNQDGVDLDFRVESNGNANMLFVDAGNNVLGVGTNAPTGFVGIRTPAVNYSSGVFNKPHIALQAEGDPDNDDGFVGITYATSSSDNYGWSGGAERRSGGVGEFVLTYHSNSATGTERTRWNLDGFIIQQTGAVFNESGGSNDFRVESDSNSNAIFSDASSGTVQFGQNSNSNTVSSVVVRGLHAAHTHLWAAHTDTNFYAANLYLNRESDDGILVDLRQANSTEGTIQVSGSTVSYNGFSGNHESSGIPTTTQIGTVVSTIDELDVYVDGPKQGKTRTDHAKVKVSNTVSDAAVYGVVSQFYENGKVIVTSVGIGSILVTGSCAKGDLLESNGDGTAKVQSDDIVRSKTIGKVTIGNSDTGVKLVSCVMYCG